MHMKRKTRRLIKHVFISIIALITYCIIHSIIVDKYFSPLCDFSSPCQNNSVSLYAFPSSAEKVASCRFSEDNSYAIVILVLSRDNEFERRISIRNSWGQKRKYRNVSVETFFLIGRERNVVTEEAEFIKEAAGHNDMILADMRDTYKNLPVKTLHGLTWVKKYCRRANFVVKVDSDAFFNIHPLIDFLYDHNYFADPNLELIGGSTCENCIPKRFLSQWAVSFSQYPYMIYPTYTHGLCYIISQKTVGKLIESQPYVRLIPNEDVYFTGIVAGMFLKTPRVNIPGIMGYSGRMGFDLKQYATYIIASHEHSLQEIRQWWTKVMEYRRVNNLL